MKKIQIIFFIIIAISAIVAENSTRKIYAAEPLFVSSNIRVSPILLKIQLEPGTKHIYPISIDNLSNAPMPIHANVEGFDPSDEQSGFTPNPPSEISPLANWITIDDPDAIIPARNSHEFFIKISIPTTVPIGGYYAVIYFTPLYPNGTIGSKIGVVTLANIGIQDSLENKARILAFQFEKPIFERGPITAILRIQNEALHYFSTKPTLSIKPFWGEQDTVELDEKTILPGKSRSWESVFMIQNSKWGIYQATVKARIESGETISKTIPLIIFPYTMIVELLIIASVIVLLIRKRKNIKNAYIALVTKDAESEMGLNRTTPISGTPQAVTQQTPEKEKTHSNGTSRMDPVLIVQTLLEQQGSVSKTARILGIHRSTIHRWKQRANNVKSFDIASLKRRSTKPLRTRTTTIPDARIKQIITMHKKKHMTAKQIKDFLHLTVSERTVLRIVKKYNSI